MKLLKQGVRSGLVRLFQRAVDLNQRNILELLQPNPGSRLLDLGCGDGEWTKAVCEQIGTANIFGVDIMSECAAKARSAGILTAIALPAPCRSEIAASMWSMPTK